MERGWKQYFEFSRRERVAVVFLILIIIILWIIPLFFKNSPILSGDISIIPITESLLTTPDSNQVIRHGEKFDNYRNSTDYLYDSTGKGNRLFYFDPNSIDAATWKQLGLKDRQVRTILNYISKGGRFRKAEDIRKVYGLSELEAGKLMPFVRIKRVDRPSLNYREEYKSRRDKVNFEEGSGEKNFKNPSRLFYEKFPTKVYKEEFTKKDISKKEIELNTATVDDLEALPGIGKVLSQRILVFREKLGGFYSVDQLAETYGLADSIFRKIRPYIRCDSMRVKRLRINDSKDSMVFFHPYFRGKLARLISVYRTEHGAFNHREDLRKLPLVDENLYNRIVPYIDLGLEAKNPP